MEYTAVDATGYGKEGSEPLSLMTHVNLDALLPESRPSEAGVVSWSPPAPNWNPWTGANIDEGKIKIFTENWDSKVPSVRTLLAYLETSAYIIFF